MSDWKDRRKNEEIIKNLLGKKVADIIKEEINSLS
jgi:hypothetical protein